MTAPINRDRYRQLMREFSSNAALQKQYPQFQYGHNYAMHILEGKPLSKPVTTAPVATTPAKQKTLAEMAIDSWKTDPAVKAHYASLGEFAEALASDPQAVLKTLRTPVSTTLSPAMAPTDQEAIWRSEYQRSPEIQAEFRREEFYIGYQKAKFRGACR